eukprot:3739840-Rhodomonas_salina.1
MEQARRIASGSLLSSYASLCDVRHLQVRRVVGSMPPISRAICYRDIIYTALRCAVLTPHMLPRTVSYQKTYGATRHWRTDMGYAATRCTGQTS